MEAILGILKAGGAYLPLDPEYPPDRLGYMLGDAKVDVLVTREELLEKLEEVPENVVLVDQDREKIRSIRIREP